MAVGGYVTTHNDHHDDGHHHCHWHGDHSSYVTESQTSAEAGAAADSLSEQFESLEGFTRHDVSILYEIILPRSSCQCVCGHESTMTQFGPPAQSRSAFDPGGRPSLR